MPLTADEKKLLAQRRELLDVAAAELSVLADAKLSNVGSEMLLHGLLAAIIAAARGGRQFVKMPSPQYLN